MEAIDTTTIIKSIKFQMFLTYEIDPLNRNPNDIIFNAASTVNITVIIMSRYFRTLCIFPFGLSNGFSKASITLEIIINTMINPSKNGDLHNW
jgi:hypothetical protein